MNLRTAILALCGLLPPIVAAQQLAVRASLDPERAGAQLPAVVPVSTDLKLHDAGNGHWSYEMNNPGRVLGVATLAMNNPPAPYQSLPLEIRMPFRSSEPAIVAVYGVVLRNTNARVREIFATPIGGPGGEQRHMEYFRLYQEAALMAEARLAPLRTGTGNMGVFNAQLFFKYLQLARQLGRVNNLVPSSGVAQVRTYMRTQLALPAGQKAIKAALGETGLATFATLLDEIDFIEAEQLRKVWAYITTAYAPHSPQACALYRAFVDTSVSREFDQGLVARWNLDENYNVVSLATEGVKVCVAKDATTPTVPASIAAIAAAQEVLQKAIVHPVAQKPDVARSIDGSLAIIRHMKF